MAPPAGAGEADVDSLVFGVLIWAGTVLREERRRALIPLCR
jgi:hypothetical protein